MKGNTQHATSLQETHLSKHQGKSLNLQSQNKKTNYSNSNRELHPIFLSNHIIYFTRSFNFSIDENAIIYISIYYFPSKEEYDQQIAAIFPVLARAMSSNELSYTKLQHNSSSVHLPKLQHNCKISANGGCPSSTVEKKLGWLKQDLSDQRFRRRTKDAFSFGYHKMWKFLGLANFLYQAFQLHKSRWLSALDKFPIRN